MNKRFRYISKNLKKYFSQFLKVGICRSQRVETTQWTLLQTKPFKACSRDSECSTGILRPYFHIRLETSSFLDFIFIMIDPYTSCLARSELVPSLAKIRPLNPFSIFLSEFVYNFLFSSSKVVDHRVQVFFMS
jgi:hypothetical protein